jgi:c-di-GMP-binding flagellar brake protein YcgR
MNETDKRAHARAQYFLIKDAGQAVPIYAFRDPEDLLAVPALVVDISDGGVQVLTADSTPLSQQIYNLELVLGSANDAELGRIEIRSVWSRADGVNIRTGFAFFQSSEVGANWSKILQDAPHRLLRCVLHPV